MNKTILSSNALMLLLLLISNYTFSQEQTVTGIVTTFDSIPLINAEVKIKSSKQIVLTDTLGNFQLMCLPGDKLKVSANGFVTNNVKLKDINKVVLVNLKLKSAPKSCDIAISNGHVSDKDQLYAISSLDKKGVDFSMYSSMYDVIRGRFPAVQVVGDKIIIRGNTSLSYSNAALIVIDGMASDSNALSSLLPVEVSSIKILKGTAAAIYGVRGANGVIEIKTKRGDE